MDDIQYERRLAPAVGRRALLFSSFQSKFGFVANPEYKNESFTFGANLGFASEAENDVIQPFKSLLQGFSSWNSMRELLSGLKMANLCFFDMLS